LGRNNRSEDVVSEIIGFALGERFESIVRPDDPQNGFHTASVTSVALGDRWLPLDFRYAPFATEVMRRRKMLRRANSPCSKMCSACDSDDRQWRLASV
jgi:hypothetical protein